jgi:hypothetical protein
LFEKIGCFSKQILTFNLLQFQEEFKRMKEEEDEKRTKLETEMHGWTDTNPNPEIVGTDPTKSHGTDNPEIIGTDPTKSHATSQ